MLALRGRELEDYQYESDLRLALNKRGRKRRRKAIISSLIKILMEPVSPAESDEELEKLVMSPNSEFLCLCVVSSLWVFYVSVHVAAHVESKHYIEPALAVWRKMKMGKCTS
jgi:hypothetical protein